MELNIGNAVRRLRRERDVTQEELANAIGVTSQAVSKWERNEGYPDITLLPGIAGFFGVTVDTVCGLDKEREKEEIEKIKNEAHRAVYPSETVAVLRKGLERFPHSFELKNELAYFLMALRDENRQQHLEESIRLHEHILEKCTDAKIRNIAQANICEAYYRAGYHEKAIAAAKELPNMYKTREVTLADMLHGDELVDMVQDGLQRWVWCFYHWVCRLRETDHYSTDEKIMLYQKVVAVYELIYENHDHLYGLRRTLCAYQDMAELYLEKGDTENCIVCLDKAADYAVMNDEFNLENGRPTSLLINRITYEGWEERDQNTRKNLAYDLTTESRYDSIRETPEFKIVLAKLTK